MADQTKKEKNTQRRKRTEGFDNKAYEMWSLCRFRVLTVMENPDTGQFYIFRTMKKFTWNIDKIIADPKTQNKLPSDVEKNRSKRRSSRKKRSRQAERETISHRSTPEKVVTEDQGRSQRGLTRVMPFLSDPPSFVLTVSPNQWQGGATALPAASRQPGPYMRRHDNTIGYNMETHTENTYHLASVEVIVAANVTRFSGPEIKDIVAKRLEFLPISCEYSGIIYSPWSSQGEVLQCRLLLGFLSDEEWEKWMLQMFDNRIDNSMDKLPAIVQAICTGNVGKHRGWALKLNETNNAQLDAIETPTKFFDSTINTWYEGVPQVRRFVLSCNDKFDKSCELGGIRLYGKGLGTTR